jgi:cytochrome P450
MFMTDVVKPEITASHPPSVDVSEMQFSTLGLISVVERAVKRHGDIVTLNLPGGLKRTVLASPDHSAFWQANPSAFHKDLSLKDSGVSVTRKVLGKTLLTAQDGKEWAQMRREMTQLLSVSKPWFQRPLAAATDQLVADLVQRPEVPLLEHCIAWAKRAICDPLIGERALDAAAQKIVPDLNGCFLAMLSDPQSTHIAATQKQYRDVMARHCRAVWARECCTFRLGCGRGWG